MSEKRKIRLEKGSGVQKILISALIGVALFFVLLCIFSVIISKSNIDFDKLKYFVYISLPVSAFLSAFLCGFKNRQLKGLVAGLLAAFVTVFILALILLIFNSGALATSAIIAIPLSVLVGLPAGVIGANLR